MHYLEDYLEIIEFLPTELKSRFVQMKELDEHVQSQLDSLNGRTKTFFTLCRKNKSEWREQQYQSLCQEYEKVMRDSAEKVRLSNQVHDLLDRHMRRLHQDLNKFTIELEADTAGITEILEQRAVLATNVEESTRAMAGRQKCLYLHHEGSYLLDQPPTPEKPQTGQKRMRHTHYDDLTIGDLDDYSPSHSTRSSPVPPIRGYKYPRRERSSALNFMDLESDFLDLEDQLTSPSSFYTGTGGKPPLPFSLETKSSRKRSSVVQPSLVVTETLPETTDWMGYVDPNEPRYCLCNQVSYGEMVGCDNPECPIEWFHYGCVGITEPPKGKWYCPQCTLSIKRKGSRKTAS